MMKYGYFMTTLVSEDCAMFNEKLCLGLLRKVSEVNMIYFDDVRNRFYLKALLNKIELEASLYVLSLHDLGCTASEIISVMKKLCDREVFLYIMGNLVDIYGTIYELEEKYANNLDQHIDDEDYLLM